MAPPELDVLNGEVRGEIVTGVVRKAFEESSVSRCLELAMRVDQTKNQGLDEGAPRVPDAQARQERIKKRFPHRFPPKSSRNAESARQMPTRRSPGCGIEVRLTSSKQNIY